MWRIGVLLVATVLFDFAAADVKPTEDLLVQRLKRSPNYCDNDDYYQRQPRYWPPPPPPPPPPPYWPPPPPPPPPPSPPFWPHHHHHFEEYSEGSKGGEPCSTCGGDKGVSSAISNAKSENGDAIAVAIAKAGPK